jgi:purine nucleoside permease
MIKGNSKISNKQNKLIIIIMFNNTMYIWVSKMDYSSHITILQLKSICTSKHQCDT